MPTLQIFSCECSVDLEKTQAYYSGKTRCDCSSCRNYYAQCETALPEAVSFLEQFGANIAYPEEIMYGWIKDQLLEYYAVYYSVNGHLNENAEGLIPLENGGLLRVSLTNGVAVPNEQQTDEYFLVCFHDLKLPWVLDEPAPEKNRPQKPSFLQRLFDKRT